MRRVCTLAFIIAVAATTFARTADARQTASAPAQTATQTCTLNVSGMTCASCDVAVRLAAKTLDGVKTVKVDYPKGKATITYDPSKTTPQAIATAITKLSGFNAEPEQKPTKK